MQSKPIFVATHPRACSTAFERVFMTQRDSLQCIHEPFGDAFYYGPERMSARFESDEAVRQSSGFAESTYQTILDRFDRESSEGKRLFIKDITYYLFPPNQQPGRIAPSLVDFKRGVGTDDRSAASRATGTDSDSDHDSGVALGEGGSTSGAAPFPFNTQAEPGNPTVVPSQVLERFHFTFLIRHPSSSIPSFYRCCVPPLIERTGFHDFMPSEAGYDELRRLFDHCREAGLVGPDVCDRSPATAEAAPKNGGVQICVIDADDLLDNPEGVLRKYCASIGIDFSPSMLCWDDDQHHAHAKEAFEKWDGWHDDAIHSKDLKPRAHKKEQKSDERLYAEWKEKFGVEGADVIKKTVADNLADYDYLKAFAIRP